MMNPASDAMFDGEIFEKIRQQFDAVPYPNVPLEQSPKENIDLLYRHDIRTAYYLRDRQVVSTAGKTILDAGCGSGYNALVLAMANPEAEIVGIDLSETSVAMARDRLRYHGYSNVTFHTLSIDDLPSLGLQFDYINCDEVLYLFPDIAQALRTLKAVLKPTGIIRTNLHSSVQRVTYFQAQEVFRLLGLLDGNPGELEMGIVSETFEALEDWVTVKQKTWTNVEERRKNKTDDVEFLLMNYLFQGDKGYTINDMFAALEAADLEWIDMVNGPQWSLVDLFKNAENLPAFWAMGLPDAPIALQLRLKELLHPMHRLLDFWCGAPQGDRAIAPPSEWPEAQWRQARVHLHPQLKTPQVYQALFRAIENHDAFAISQFIPSTQTKEVIFLKNPMSACLLPLWEGPQTVQFLIDRWLHIHPCNIMTLEPTSAEQAFLEVTNMVAGLEARLYLLLEPA